MPIFDVTIVRTGCVTVEADTEDAAMLIAADLPTEDVSWTDEWEVAHAEPIAANIDEMGDDTGLVVKDPLIRAKMLAKQCGFFCCPSTDGRLCMTPYNAANNIVSITDLKEMMMDHGYTAEIISATGAGDSKLEDGDEMYTRENLSEITGVPQSRLTGNAHQSKFLLVGLPDTAVWKMEA